ncbi:MAG: MauE/DoxX family redox-associated membrane protein [Pyrinomonadaceae bacterium]
MQEFLLLIRLLLAAIFGLAGIAKFLDLKGSEKAFKEFGVPAIIARPSSIALSVLEIVIAVLFLSTATSWYASVGALFLLVLFIGQMVYQMARGNAPDCHCFGQLHSEPVSKKSIVRNIVFAVPAAFLVYQGNGQQGSSLTDAKSDIVQSFFGLAIVALLVAVLLYLKEISSQQTALIKRIEVMELVARDGGQVTREDVGHPHEGLPIGAVFPDFVLPDLNQNIVSLADVRADNFPALFIFVSPSCNPCKALVPEFEEWQAVLSDKLKLVFVSTGEPEENAEKFVGEAEQVFLIQDERELAELVRAKWTPTAVLMDRHGRIASHVAAGDAAIRELVEKIKGDDFRQEVTYFTNGNGHSHSNNKIGEIIPEFSLADIKGIEIGNDYFKGKQTLVAFWSPTCPHCVEMMSDLREWDETKDKDDPHLIVFSEGEKSTHDEFGLTSPIILEKDYKTAAEFGMFGTPSAVLVNENGTIISETALGASDIWALVGKRK